MKRLFTLLIILSGLKVAGQANDNCVNATNLTVNGPLLCGQTMNASASGLETNECFVNYSGTSESTVWYSFTATQTQMIFNFIATNNPGCVPTLQVYGPFASVAAGCSNSAVFGGPCGGYNWLTNNTYQGSEFSTFLQSNGDPGNHMLLTGLTVGGVYLIHIQGEYGGFPTCSPLPVFCISVDTKAVNSSPPAAAVINACGVTFTGTTNGGYYNNGAENGGGFGNLDNCPTTCPSCLTPGDDVPYVINNVSWYTFCASTAGTWNVSFAVNNCVLPNPNNGAQIAIFSGPPCGWTQTWQSPTGSCAAAGNAQVPAGCSVLSTNFNVAAGACAYMCVDGFAGDACDYQLVLTNVLGGCTVLPVELAGFTSRCEKGRLIFEWATETEKNSDYFTIEKSLDGKTFYPVGIVKAAGNSAIAKKYIFSTKEESNELAYYRLSETDINGTVKTFNTNAMKGCDAAQKFVSWASGDQINISVTSKLAGNYKVELYDLSGNLVITKEQYYSEGNSIATIPVGSETGIYFLRIIGDDENQSKKIFIQK